MAEKQILVLGVGNILLKDEGVGVRVVEQLQAEYAFSPNVELMDGGTLGIRLLEYITKADHMIVIDAVRNEHSPGTLYRLLGDEITRCISFKNSLHQTDLMETLAYAEMLGKRPTTVVIGVEPMDISPWGVQLTETIKRRVPEMMQKVLEEVCEAGGSYTKKTSA